MKKGVNEGKKGHAAQRAVAAAEWRWKKALSGTNKMVKDELSVKS